MKMIVYILTLTVPMHRLFKGPYKWTFFKTSLLHVFYQFWHAEYEYDTFKMKKMVIMIFG